MSGPNVVKVGAAVVAKRGNARAKSKAEQRIVPVAQEFTATAVKAVRDRMHGLTDEPEAEEPKEG